MTERPRVIQRKREGRERERERERKREKEGKVLQWIYDNVPPARRILNKRIVRFERRSHTPRRVTMFRVKFIILFLPDQNKTNTVSIIPVIVKPESCVYTSSCELVFSCKCL